MGVDRSVQGRLHSLKKVWWELRDIDSTRREARLISSRNRHTGRAENSTTVDPPYCPITVGRQIAEIFPSIKHMLSLSQQTPKSQERRLTDAGKEFIRRDSRIDTVKTRQLMISVHLCGMYSLYSRFFGAQRATHCSVRSGWAIQSEDQA